MNPLTNTQAELVLVVAKAEQRAAAARAKLARTFSKAAQADDLHDHRTAVAGDIADALDRLQPQLGTRLMQAMYPEVDLSEGG
jgi:hypothetical protein